MSKHNLPVLIHCSGASLVGDLIADTVQCLQQQEQVRPLPLSAIMAGSPLHIARVKMARHVIFLDDGSSNQSVRLLRSLCCNLHHIEVASLLNWEGKQQGRLPLRSCLLAYATVYRELLPILTVQGSAHYRHYTSR